MTKLHDLAELGQSIWVDHIRRAFIKSGELQELINQGVTGVIADPTVFARAIAGSADYDAALATAVSTSGAQTPDALSEALAVEDIRQAADLLRQIYDDTGGADGYVSLAISPALTGDTYSTVAAAQRLFAAVARPNVMIDIPATTAGIPTISALIGAGINVNAKLLFSITDYNAVANAYLDGLEALAANGGDLAQVTSTASFVISHLDAAVDGRLAALGSAEARELQGKIAIANARMAYQGSLAIFSGQRWQKLAAQGAHKQRLLWTSTGVRNPAYPDTLYMNSLIGRDTISTAPLSTLNAYLHHGVVDVTVADDIGEAQAVLEKLSRLGIDLDAITIGLQTKGVAALVNAFQKLLDSVAEKQARLQVGRPPLMTELGQWETAVDAAVQEIRSAEILKRIWQHDHTVWREDPAEITNRLGWLTIPEVMAGNLDRLNTLLNAVRANGYTHALLLGMGGSSLAPEVFYKTFGRPAGADNAFLELTVLDSTDPGAVLAAAHRLDYARTLFIVATKSGGTVETLSGFKYFYNEVAASLGEEAAGRHFVAITDPGSNLAKLARDYHFRDIFLNDPNIGGRYSALSYFGLVPATLVGVDVARLLDSALNMAGNNASCNCPWEGNNQAGRLGAILGELAKAGRDKVTLVTSPAIAGFGDWVEQLIAESTGKEGKGILPVVGETLGQPEVYGDDRLFVHLRLAGDDSQDAAVAALAAAGHPLVRIDLADKYELGGQFFLWEMATAVAGQRLDIQPFDQPDVEAAKILARQMVAAYHETGRLPAGETAPLTAESLTAFLAQAKTGDYIALQAYLQPTAAAEAALQALRTRLRDQTRLATSLGFGPRFLHSTGQLHKGDAGNGLFIQFLGKPAQDVAIPDEAGRPESAMSFGVLIESQALGDGQALLDANRRFIRFRLAELETLATLFT